MRTCEFCGSEWDESVKVRHCCSMGNRTDGGKHKMSVIFKWNGVPEKPKSALDKAFDVLLGEK